MDYQIVTVWKADVHVDSIVPETRVYSTIEHWTVSVDTSNINNGNATTNFSFLDLSELREKSGSARYEYVPLEPLWLGRYLSESP